MINLIKNIFDNNERTINKLRKIVDEINSLEATMKMLTDEELRDKTEEFKKRYAAEETLDELLPEAFAVVREASVRVLGMRHYDVQLIGGIVLHQGRIAEMKTGEGKTLVATLPCYLNALTGKGVHVITVNDYLAKRDSQWMGQVYEFLGLSVGLIIHEIIPFNRDEQYAKDIIYGTNNEFGFDYLRNNMAISEGGLTQRGLNYAIIDEVDSILIDEARTPLIISGQADKPTTMYYTVAKIIPKLKKEADYTLDEKEKHVTLTEDGLARVEKMLGVDSIYEGDNAELGHHVNQALKAHVLMKRDVDYVVKDGEIIIVDEFTGRLMFGRRYSEGLHQAIEAKENVKIARESQTLATITFQNFFRLYSKIAGMTGTAKTEEDEFLNIYGLDVVEIPTHMPCIRDDRDDLVYRTVNGKFNAVVEEVEGKYRKGQPVLVGTVSIEKSEELGKMLEKRNVPHQILNAKHHEQEAEIVANAGQLGMVTIATNMAGRGTDIVLGEGVKELGGLCIIGTERHESRRIDNQLRGRAGRQGDPGSSVFYVSLEDDLMRLFGGDNLQNMMDKFGMDDNTPIDHPLLSKAIERAQKRVEANNFDVRKHVLEYDNVMNKQRNVIYKQRKDVLENVDLKDDVLNMIDAVIDYAILNYSAQSNFAEDWDLEGLLIFAEQTFLPKHSFTVESLKTMVKSEVEEAFKKTAREIYDEREEVITSEKMRQLEKLVILRVVDMKWMDHIEAMQQLKNGIGLRAYGQKDPLIEYQREGFDMFQDMVADIKEEVCRMIYRVNIVEQPVSMVKNVHQSRGEDEEEPADRTVRKGQKVGRNDPCPCGSGKKYKHCCGQ